MSDPAAPDPRIGTTIGARYELLRALGRGATSVVYEAKNVLTERRVAVKALDLGATARVRERFVLEARTAARLTHPNIVRVDEAFADGGTLFLVEELLDGPSLDRVIEARGLLPLEEALRMLLPIADALAHAHDHGIVHRDVKPSNVVVATTADGSVVPKLVDFGIAKELEGGNTARLSLEGMILGTPEYMAPEQITDGKSVDARADQWALAVCLHEAITGDVPFAATRVMPLLDEIVRFDASSDAFLPGTSGPVREVLRRALRVDPRERFVSMRDLASALELALREAHARADRATSPPPQDLLDAETTDDGRSAARETIDAPAPPPLRLGMVVTARDVDPVRVQDALREVLGARASVLRMASYAELGTALERGEIDLAWLPPIAYARALASGTARGLAAIERAGLAEYASAILARGEVITGFEDLAGARAAWVDPWSAAGYLVPLATLRAHGVEETSLASQSFVGSYDAVMDALLAGTADVGATYCVREETLPLLDAPSDDELGLRVLAISDPIPSDVIAISTRAPRETEERVGALLRDERTGAPLLEAIRATRFAPADPTRYARLVP